MSFNEKSKNYISLELRKILIWLNITLEINTQYSLSKYQIKGAIKSSLWQPSVVHMKARERWSYCAKYSTICVIVCLSQKAKEK